MRHERASDREHLLLATGERARELLLALLETRKELVHPRHVAVHVAQIAARVRPHHEVVEHDHSREEPPSLGRLAYAEAHDLVRLRIRDVAAVEHDAAAGRVHEAGDRAQRRGLPRAVGADERDDLARRNGERHAAQGLHAAVEDVDPIHLEERCRRRRRGRHQCCFPRYASMTRWSLRTCSGVPSAIFSP